MTQLCPNKHAQFTDISWRRNTLLHPFPSNWMGRFSLLVLLHTGLWSKMLLNSVFCILNSVVLKIFRLWPDTWHFHKTSIFLKTKIWKPLFQVLLRDHAKLIILMLVTIFLTAIFHCVLSLWSQLFGCLVGLAEQKSLEGLYIYCGLRPVGSS